MRVGAWVVGGDVVCALRRRLFAHRGMGYGGDVVCVLIWGVVCQFEVKFKKYQQAHFTLIEKSARSFP